MHKKLILINQLIPFIVLASLVTPHLSLAVSLPSADSFGSSDVTDVPGWNESGNNTVVTHGSSGDDASRSGSPTPQFAKIDHNDGYICKQFDTTGHGSVHFHYYWKGDSHAGSSDHGFVEWKGNANTSSCGSGGSWTNLATHSLNTTSWSLQQDVTLPTGDTFLIRFKNSANSSDEFFRVDDVSFTDTVANVAPTATAQSQTTDEDTAKAITLAGTDTDGTIASFAIVTNPSHGALSGFNSGTGAVTYTPTANYNGSDSFTFRVTDNLGVTSTPATVSLTITPVNDPPFITAVSITSATPKTNDTVTANVTAGDVDLTTPTFTYQWKKNGTDITGATGSTLNLATAGNGDKGDVLTVAVVAHDAVSTSTTFTSAGVTVQNSAPVAMNQSLPATNEDATSSITLTATDADNDTLTYAIGTSPAHGAISGLDTSTGALVYTPTLNYNGADTFTFTANDGTATSPAGTVNVSMIAVDDAPVLANISSPKSINELTTLTFTAQATDPEGDPFHFSLIGAPEGASIDNSTGVFTWTPTEAQGPGSYTFTVRVTQDNDEGGTKYTEQNVTVEVKEVNIAPVADNGTATTTIATPVVITLGGHDDDLPANTLTYLIVGAPLHGTLSDVSENRVTYTPDVGFGGYDAFTFRLLDNTYIGEGGDGENYGAYSNTATVKITVVDPPHESPTAGNYPGDVDVSFTAEGASSIVYTVDRAEPACSSSLVYSYPITIHSNNMFKVISCYDGHDDLGPATDSDTHTFEYSYGVPQTTPPLAGGGVTMGGGNGGGQVLGVSTTTEPESTGNNVATTTVPQVLGVSTTTEACEPLLSEYMSIKRKNNPAEVTKLQLFLAKELGVSLDATGIFDLITEKVVKMFQLKYDDEVLAPWAAIGLITPHTPTGSVFKLTLWKINAINSPACALLPKPSIR